MSAEPHLVEPVQRPGEDWITFSRRWGASPFGVARRAKGAELNRTVGAEIRAERIRDARIADHRRF